MRRIEYTVSVEELEWELWVSRMIGKKHTNIRFLQEFIPSWRFSNKMIVYVVINKRIVQTLITRGLTAL